MSNDGPQSNPTMRDILLWIRYRQCRRRLWNAVTAKSLRRLSDQEFERIIGISTSADNGVEELHRMVKPPLLFRPENKKDFFLSLLMATQEFDDILNEGDEVLQNRYELPGAPSVDVGDPVEWHKDFRSGRVWKVVPAHTIDLIAPRSDSDVRIVWELNRFHQVWWLGKAFWITGNQEYSRKFVTLIEDWIGQNPVGMGVNWAMPMEAAIRACNWVSGYSFFANARDIDPTFWLKFFKSLYSHGIYVEQNLEYALAPGNHLLSNIGALIVLGSVFSWTGFGRRWREWGLRQIEKEMVRQVYPDGVSYEKSIAYQRLIMELFYVPTILAQRQGHRFSDGYVERLRKMFMFLEAVSRPDGSFPMFGDSDDGRLFRVRRKTPLYDSREASSVGAVLFGDPILKEAAGSLSQEALWHFGAEGFERLRTIRAGDRKKRSVLFPRGGYAVLTAEDAHIVVDVGSIGMEGKGGHGHNDTLSFEYWKRGGGVVVDPGTYLYTGDVKAREEFRSAFSHNTIVVDHREPVKSNGLWRISSDTTHPRVIEWKVGDGVDLLVAEYRTSGQSANQIIHRRRMEFDISLGAILIVDEVRGTGIHHLLLSFHFHPVCVVKEEALGGVSIRRGESSYRLECSEPGSRLVSGWHSPAYGTREESIVFEVEWEGKLPHVITSRFRPTDEVG